MPEWLAQIFASDPSYSYVAVGTLFILCGVGLPLPEEIILVSAGYICYQGHATFWVMVLVCAGSILVGDVIPFLLGNLFGPRLLRLKWLRLVVNRERLAMFDRWFRRRGDLVILIARFIPGLRVVAFFTGGTMRMRWGRFLMLDTFGIALTAPTFAFVGWHFGDKIEETFKWVQQVESSILYLACASAGVFGTWYWLRRRARRRRLVAGPRETFVEPTRRELAPPASVTVGPRKADGSTVGETEAVVGPATEPTRKPQEDPHPGSEVGEKPFEDEDTPRGSSSGSGSTEP